MENKFVADGSRRFLRAGKKLPTLEEIELKYAAKLARAVPSQQSKICEEMARELSRRERMLHHKPSAKTVW